MHENLSNKYNKFENIENVIKYIDNNYTENHPVQHYANMCNLDRYYFIKLFKEYTGISPVFYRTKIRIEKAKELLTTTQMSIAEIAEMVGYQNPYYFSRIFKIHTGISPYFFKPKN